MHLNFTAFFPVSVETDPQFTAAAADRQHANNQHPVPHLVLETVNIFLLGMPYFPILVLSLLLAQQELNVSL